MQQMAMTMMYENTIDDVATTSNINVATNQYIDSVRSRLSSTKEQDRMDQKDRIRQKHKKRRLELKGDRDESTSATAILNTDVASGNDDADEGTSECDSYSNESTSDDDMMTAPE